MDDPLPLNYKNWFDAAITGDIEQLRFWHRKGDLSKSFDPSRVKAVVRSGRPRAQHFVDEVYEETALHKALSNSRLEYVLELLKVCHWDLLPNKKGEYPLHFLMDTLVSPDEKRRLLAQEVMDKLLDLNHPVGPSSRSNSTPLMWLLKGARENSQIMKPLLQLLDRGACFDGDDMVTAIRSCQVEVVDLLLARDPQKALEPGEWGENKLFSVAAIWDRLDDENEHTPLRQIMRSLLRAGADPNTVLVERNGGSATLESVFREGGSRQGYQVLTQMIREVQAEKLDQATREAIGHPRAHRL